MPRFIEDNFQVPLSQDSSWRNAETGQEAYVKGLRLDDTFHIKDVIPPGPNYNIVLNFKVVGNPTTSRVYIIARWNPPENSTGKYYFVVYSRTDNQSHLAISKVENAQQVDYANLYLPDKAYSLEFKLENDVLTATIHYQGGFSSIQITNSEIASAGVIGLYGDNNLEDDDNYIVVNSLYGDTL